MNLPRGSPVNPPVMNPVIRLTCIAMLSLGCAGIVSVNAQDTQKPAEKPKPAGPVPSGEQTDGAFRKVILDGDSLVNGQLEDTVKDPMEMAVTPDGRVLWAERAGVVKMWKPDSKSTVVIGRSKSSMVSKTACSASPSIRTSRRTAGST